MAKNNEAEEQPGREEAAPEAAVATAPEALRSTVDALQGINRDGDRSSPLIEQLQPAGGQNLSPDSKLLQSNVNERIQEVIKEIKPGSPADKFLHSGNALDREKIRQGLIDEALGNNPERSKQAIDELKKVTFLESAITLSNTLGSSNPDQSRERYAAIRQLAGLSLEESSGNGNASTLLETLKQDKSSRLGAEVSAAKIDKECERDELQDQSLKQLKEIFADSDDSSLAAFTKLNRLSQVALANGICDISTSHDLANDLLKLRQTSKQAQTANTLLDGLNTLNLNGSNAAGEVLKSLWENKLLRYDSERGRFSEIGNNEIDWGQAWKSKLPKPAEQAGNYPLINGGLDSLQTYNTEVGAARSARAESEKTAAVAAEKPADKNRAEKTAAKTSEPPNPEQIRQAGLKLIEQFMTADRNHSKSTEMMGRTFGKAKIEAYIDRNNKDGKSFFSKVTADSPLAKIPGVERNGDYFSFKGEPFKDGNSWKMLILGKDNKPTAILSEDGSVEKLKPNIKCPDGTQIDFDYDGNGVKSVKDGHGSSWTRSEGSKDEWKVNRGNGEETLKGKVTVGEDGSYKFVGKDANGKDITIEQRLDGTTVETSGDIRSTVTRNTQGESVRKVEDLSGEKPRITEVIKTNAKGETEFVLKPVEGKENTWSSEKLGEIKGELSVSPEGKLIFSQTVASERGTFKTIGRDENGEIQTLSSEFKEGEKPEVWTRVGDSNWWTSDQGKMNCARVENGEFQPIDAQDLSAQKESLDKVAVHAIKDEKQRAEFLANVEAFLTRAQKDGISNAEVAKSLEHLSRLMVAPDGNTAISQDDRVKIAQQAIRQAADPTTIDQGQNNTCNVTTVENLLYTKQPSVVFKVIADVATTGSFTTKDGKSIAIHPSCLKPDNEARNHPTIDGDRSYASQIFQHAAIATFWQSEADSKFRYVKVESRLGRTDTGERIAEVDANGNFTGKFRTDHEGKLIKSPHFGAYQMEKAWEALGGTPRYCQISGTFKNEYKDTNKPIPKGRASDHFRTGIDPGVFGGYKVDSPESLGKLIKQLEDSKSLPIIMRVNASKPPFAPKSDKIDKNEHAAHVVVIRGIIPGPPAKAIVDNQWGKESDKHMLLTDLFGALD